MQVTCKGVHKIVADGTNQIVFDIDLALHLFHNDSRTAEQIVGDH